MALFQLRKKKVDEPRGKAAPAASPAESVEAMRRRARHRLIGAVVLVLAGVIGFPLLFDTQPRPVAVDIPIEIPDRNKAGPLTPPTAAAPTPAAVATGRPSAEPTAVISLPPAAPAAVTGKPAASSAAVTARPPGAPVAVTSQPPAAPAAVTSQPPAAPAAVTGKPPAAPAVVPAAASVGPKEEILSESRPLAAPPAVARALEPAPDRKAEPGLDAARAQALLEARSVDAAAGRYVVQVGAFAEEAKARQAQQKLERAGLRNYRQVAETEEGKRIRVRAGPFASRAEADKAAEKIKGLELPVRILTL